MSGSFLSKRMSRRIIIFFGILLLGAALVVAGMQLILVKINQNREEMVAKLRQEIDLPLTFNSIEARWSGLSLGVFVKHVAIFDPKVPIAFVSIENIALFPEISSLLFKDTLRLKKMVLQELKLVIGWDDKNDLSILGLKAEPLPTSIDYKAFVNLLSKLQTIVVEDAKIEWRGPNLLLKQSIRGEFNWLQSKTIDWKFVGTQQLQIREALNLPESRFNLWSSPNPEEIGLKLAAGGLSAQCSLQRSEDTKWHLDCSAESGQLNLAEMPAYYHPAETDFPLLKWLYEALPSGKITDATINIKGPFDALKGFGEIHFKGTQFQYAPDWPKIEKARGLVTIESERVTVKVTKGAIMGSPIQNLTGQILPIGGVEKPVVSVEGTVDSTLEKGLLFLQKSPLRTSVAENLKILNPRGLMHLNLKCTVPLDTQPVKVDGSISVKNGQLDIPDWPFSINQLNGTFQFTEAALEASNVLAQLGHLPISLNVKTTTVVKQKALEVKATGLINATFLQQQFPVPFLEKLQGQSLFTLLLNKPLEQINPITWSLSSDLEGMKINLPSFLGKTPNEKIPMTLSIGSEIKGERKIALQLSKRVDAKLTVMGPSDHLSIKSGHVVFGGGSANWTSKQSLFVDGEIGHFKTDEWLDFFDEIKGNNQKIFPPLNIHVLVGRLEIYGLGLDNTWVSVNFAETPLKWQVDGPRIKGSFVAATEKSRQAEIKLAYLKIISSNAPLQTKVVKELADIAKKPVRFYCQDLQYDQGNFGELSFKLMPASYGYQIQDFLLETSQSELSGNGEWHLGAAGVYTTLQGKLKSIDMGKTLSRWNYPTAIRESSGTIQYQLRWPKHPFQFKLGIVDGNAELKFDKGRILGVNPGLGRIMGLLNLENIHRRLQLDFSDLVKKGFVFDTLKGNFQFQNGVAKTEKLSIDGPSAKITIAGKANMNTKAVDLDMAVAPHVEIGIPLATAIAVGNPAVGAGLWIIDKLTGSKINKMTQHKYHVTGSWDAPNIAEATTRPATQ